MEWRKGTLYLLVTALAAVVVLAGCNLFNPPKDTFANAKIELNNNSGRIESGDAGRLEKSETILNFSAKSAAGSKGAKVVALEPPVPEGYAIIAEVNAPSYPEDQNKKLGATSVFISQDYRKAYVSYNLPGDERFGAIDIIDIADPAKPELKQSVLFRDTDINAVFVYKYGTGGFMYIAGSMSESRLAELAGRAEETFKDQNATLERLTLTSEGLFSTKADGSLDTAKLYSKLTNLPGYQTTSVYQSYYPASRYVFATSGDHPSGGTFVLSYLSFPSIIDQDLYDNAKYLDIELDRELTGFSPKQITLEGGRKSKGTLHIYTVGKSDASAHLTIDIGELDTSESQNSVDLYKNIAYLALGSAGMKAYDITRAPDNTPIYQMTKTEPASEVVCNSVASDGTMVYMAMGAGGLWVAPLNYADDEGNVPAFEASNFGASANFVTYDSSSGLIFVAGGTQGLKILRTGSQSESK